MNRETTEEFLYNISLKRVIEYGFAMKHHSVLKMLPGLLLALVVLTAAGCGQKGDLYLPEPAAADQNKDSA